jgi:beta-lactam-binding protein with PASTA domain
VAATTFTVEGEEKITAVAPAQTKVGRVDITTTTLAGDSPTVRADSFYYAGCTVPNVVGKKLGNAKATLRGAGCGIGKVTKVKAPAKKNGKVVKQGARPGALLAPGAKIPVKLVVVKKAKTATK